MSSKNSDWSVVGTATRLTGRVSGNGGLRIEGALNGDVNINGPAEIAEGGQLEGDISAESVEIAGSLVGDVDAQGAVAIRAGASVRGALKGSEVSVEPGSRVSIRLDTEFELDLGAPARRK